MEIRSLTLHLSAEDLSHLARKAAKEQEQVRDLEIRITDQHIIVKGVYVMMMKISFETFWLVGVEQGKFTASLKDMSVVGLGAGMLRGIFMRMIAEEAKKTPGVEVREETIYVDADSIASKQGGIATKLHLRTARCLPDTLVIEAGYGVG